MKGDLPEPMAAEAPLAVRWPARDRRDVRLAEPSARASRSARHLPASPTRAGGGATLVA
jgi:hypothetical protein